jgi:hypothetical protein
MMQQTGSGNYPITYEKRWLSYYDRVGLAHLADKKKGYRILCAYFRVCNSMRLRSLALAALWKWLSGRSRFGMFANSGKPLRKQELRTSVVGQLIATSIQHDCILLGDDDMLLTHSRSDGSSPL